MQSKLTGNGRLLNSDGTLTQSGYSTSAVLEYDRKAVKGNKLAIREWDRYIICNENFAVSYAVADNSYYGYISFTLTDFEQKWTHTAHITNILPLGRTGLPSSPAKGDITHFDKKYFISFKHDGTARRLVCHFDNFYKGKPLDADILLSQPPEETISVALPFNGGAKAFITPTR